MLTGLDGLNGCFHLLLVLDLLLILSLVVHVLLLLVSLGVGVHLDRKGRSENSKLSLSRPFSLQFIIKVAAFTIGC